MTEAGFALRVDGSKNELSAGDARAGGDAAVHVRQRWIDVERELRRAERSARKRENGVAGRSLPAFDLRHKVAQCRYFTRHRFPAVGRAYGNVFTLGLTKIPPRTSGGATMAPVAMGRFS